MGLPFTLHTQIGKARRGTLTTAHGTVETPAFMPVGTAGTVKAMLPESVRATGAEILLGNTYHLMLRPGEKLVAAMGGLHRFMNWNRPILTDSGGFQVMSLAGLRKITDDGVTFNSHVDGKRYHLTPAYSIEIQHALDSNITMCLDECTAYPCTYAAARLSMERSMAWAALSKGAFVDRAGYGIFGIMQGSMFPDLREASAKRLLDIGFDGYAIGGLAIGEGQQTMFQVLDYAPDFLPADKPRYLMGVGRPADIVGAVARGVDMFDCVLPTRAGRNAKAFTRRGELNLKNARHRADPRPLDAQCLCPACTQYSRAYLHHLIKAGEILGAMLLTWHNLQYYQDLMLGIRTAITDGVFDSFQRDFFTTQALGDIAPLDV